LICGVGLLMLQAIPYAITGGSYASYSLSMLIWIGGMVFFAAGHMIDAIDRIANSEKTVELDA
jgi:hypothetical protein